MAGGIGNHGEQARAVRRVATGLVAAGMVASMTGCLKINVRFGEDTPQEGTPAGQGGQQGQGGADGATGTTGVGTTSTTGTGTEGASGTTGSTGTSGGSGTAGTNANSGTSAGGSGGAAATGTGSGGGWTTYHSSEDAAADIGFSLDIPSVAYGRKATDFLVRSDSKGNRFLWYEYWDDDVTAMEEFGIVAKMRGGMPPTPAYDTSENRHEVDMGGTPVVMFGDDSETLAGWTRTDSAGETWGYYVKIGQRVSDPEMISFISQIK